jgi:hypothetical protein
MQYLLYIITRHLAPFDVKLGSIWLSRILKCKKENDGRLPWRHQIISKTYLGLSQVSMKWKRKHRALIKLFMRPNDRIRQLGEWLFLNANSTLFSAISRREQINFQWDDDEVRFDLDQQAWLNFNSASLLKQKYTGRYVVQLADIILNLSKWVFVLSP